MYEFLPRRLTQAVTFVTCTSIREMLELNSCPDTGSPDRFLVVFFRLALCRHSTSATLEPLPSRYRQRH